MGMIAMILLFPVPGYVASMIQGVQKEKMKKVSDLTICRSSSSALTLSPLD